MLPEGEILPRVLARVERDALSLADLEDGFDHSYVPTLLFPPLADNTISLPFVWNHEEREVVCRLSIPWPLTVDPSLD